MADRRYETLVVIHPDLGEPGAKDLVNRIRGIVEAQGATVSQVQEWGMRELAFPIEKQKRGFYALFEYRGSPAGLSEVERQLKIMDNVLRHVSVRQAENAPPAAPPRTLRRDADELPPEGGEAEAAAVVEGEGA